MSTQSDVRVRFAPSPTGHLHIGGLRTALYNWLYARHYGGTFLVRIEDTDVERSTQEYRDSILNSFAWIGLNIDEEIVTQTDRVDEHRKVAYELVAQGKAYRCFCSAEEIVARYEQKTEGDFYVSYDGYCRNRIATEEDLKKSYAIRFKIPSDRTEVSWNDLIRDTIVISTDQLDDFIILRSNGLPIYNFVVVVDDAYMKISHVIRGGDHIANTPKQILLYEACGYTIPAFAHLTMILGPSGDKLSKRDGATSVIEYRREGYIAQALLNYLARLGWSHGDQEIFSLPELIEYFSLDHVGKKDAIFDFEKLAWVNSVYIRQMTNEALLEHIIRDVEPVFLTNISWNLEAINCAIALYKERVKTLKALVEEVMLLYSGPRERNSEDMKKWIKAETLSTMSAFIEFLEQQPIFMHDELAAHTKEFVARLGIKLVDLLQPVRLALLGKTSGPGVFEMLALLGKTESIARLCALRDSLCV